MRSGMPSPLLKRIRPDELPEKLSASWRASMRLRGDAIFFEVLGNNPELFHWYVQRFYGELFDSGSVDRHYKELLRLRLSSLHGCRFCNQGNRADALAAGIPEAKVEAIGHYEKGPFSEAEKSVLQLADRIALTCPDGALDTTLYVALGEHFNDGQILELGMLAGMLSGVAKFLFAFDLVEKEASCPFVSTHHDT